METNIPRYAVVTKNGELICISGADSVETLPVEKVTPENIFTHFRCDLEDFKAYVKSLDNFNLPKNPFSGINLEECSFLEVRIDEESGKLLL